MKLILINCISEMSNFIIEIVSCTIQLVTIKNFHSYPNSFYNNPVRSVIFFPKRNTVRASLIIIMQRMQPQVKRFVKEVAASIKKSGSVGNHEKSNFGRKRRKYCKHQVSIVQKFPFIGRVRRHF